MIAGPQAAPVAAAGAASAWIAGLHAYRSSGGSSLLSTLVTWVAHAAVWQTVRKLYQHLTIPQAIALTVVVCVVWAVVRRRRPASRRR